MTRLGHAAASFGRLQATPLQIEVSTNPGADPSVPAAGGDGALGASGESLSQAMDDVAQPEWGRRAARAERLLLAQAFVEDNLHRPELTPAVTAAALGISVRQLHMLFEPTGTTFSNYLLLRRLERARTLLAQRREARIMDIGLDCGIPSSTVLYRGFQRAFGTTPAKYRRSIKPPR